MALLESFSFSEFGVDAGNHDDNGSGTGKCGLVLLGKFISSKPPSRHTIVAVLKRAWESLEGWTMLELTKGIFQFTFKLAKDRDTALARRPWTIRGSLLLLERWPDHLQLEEIQFSSCPVWVRLSGLPPAMLADSPLSRIARLFREVTEKRVGKEAKFAAYARFQAVINVSLALKPGFFLDRPNLPSIWIQAHYENVGKLCFRCGCLGHGASECSAAAEILASKEGFPEVPLYGEWIAAGSTVATCFTNGGRPRSTPTTAHSASNGSESPTVDAPPKDRTLTSGAPSREDHASEPRSATKVRGVSDAASFDHTTIFREKGAPAPTSFRDPLCQKTVDLPRHPQSPARASKPRAKKPKRSSSGPSGSESRTTSSPEAPVHSFPSSEKPHGVPRSPTPLQLGPPEAPRGAPPPISSSGLVDEASGGASRGSPRVASPSKVLPLTGSRGPLSPKDPPRSPTPDGTTNPSGRGKRRRTLDPSGTEVLHLRSPQRHSPILTRSSSRQDISGNSPHSAISAARVPRAVRTP